MTVATSMGKVAPQPEGTMHIHSADHFFIHDGVYTFNPNLLGTAHATCLRSFAEKVRTRLYTRCLILRGIPGSGKSTLLNADDRLSMLEPHVHPFISQAELVVDNTNITWAEVAPYASLASAYDMSVEVWTLRVDPKLAQNTHGVPAAAVQRMDARMREELTRTPAFWRTRIFDRDDAKRMWIEEMR